MKIVTSDNQLEITESGLGQVIVGVIFMVLGVGTAVVPLIIKAANRGNQFNPLLTLGIGAILLVVGGLIMAFAQNRHFVFQLGANTTIESKRMFGGKQDVQSFPTASIVAVRLLTSETHDQSSQFGQSDNSNASSPTRRSVLSVVLNNNDIVTVAQKSSAVSGGIGSIISHAPLTKEATKLAEFLKLPLDAEDASSLISVVKMIKEATQVISAPVAQNPSVPPAQPPVPPPTAGTPSFAQPPNPPVYPPQTPPQQ
jgi:hypothetical protein